MNFSEQLANFNERLTSFTEHLTNFNELELKKNNTNKTP